MSSLAQHVVAGAAAGGTYGLLALALVLVRRASGFVNLAQGELAALSAFVCGALIEHGWRFWTAFFVTVGLSLAVGAVVAGLAVRPVVHGPAHGPLLLVVGSLLAVNGLDRWIWGGLPRTFHGPFSAGTAHVAGQVLARRDLGVLAVAVVTAAVVLVGLRQTRLGLGLEAAAGDAVRARGSGLAVEWIRALAWGLAAALGAVAGILTAIGRQGIEPNTMRPAILFALAAAVLGGLDSPLGAVVAGLVLGVGVELVEAYVHHVGPGLGPVVALGVLTVALLVRPWGVFGRPPPAVRVGERR